MPSTFTVYGLFDPRNGQLRYEGERLRKRLGDTK
jgi:hypothetical protein